MRMQRAVVCAYGLLLRMYPSGFRKRFAPEMLELAGAAESREWPLIFADTGVAILRCWLEGSPSTAAATHAAATELDAYLSLGGSSLRNLGLGFVLSTAIIAGLAYMGYRMSPPCTGTNPLLTHVVEQRVPASAPPR